jgi:hypothetical protein
MPVFPKPTFAYAFNPAQQIGFLLAHKATRLIPQKAPNTLPVATWNIANLGAQKRGDEHRSLLAEILSWFDIIAIQECRENFGDLFDILVKLGSPYRALLSDKSGNDERMAFLCDSAKLTLQEEVGEIAYPVSQLKNIKLAGISQKFSGFDRTPYLASFREEKQVLIHA